MPVLHPHYIFTGPQIAWLLEDYIPGLFNRREIMPYVVGSMPFAYPTLPLRDAVKAAMAAFGERHVPLLATSEKDIEPQIARAQDHLFFDVLVRPHQRDNPYAVVALYRFPYPAEPSLFDTLEKDRVLLTPGERNGIINFAHVQKFVATLIEYKESGRRAAHDVPEIWSRSDEGVAAAKAIFKRHGWNKPMHQAIAAGVCEKPKSAQGAAAPQRPPQRRENWAALLEALPTSVCN